MTPNEITAKAVRVLNEYRTGCTFDDWNKHKQWMCPSCGSYYTAPIYEDHGARVQKHGETCETLRSDVQEV